MRTRPAECGGCREATIEYKYLVSSLLWAGGTSRFVWPWLEHEAEYSCAWCL